MGSEVINFSLMMSSEEGSNRERENRDFSGSREEGLWVRRAMKEWKGKRKWRREGIEKYLGSELGVSSG